MNIHSFDVSIYDGGYSAGGGIYPAGGWWVKPSVSAMIEVHCPKMPEPQHQLDQKASAYLELNNMDCTKPGSWTVTRTTDQLFEVSVSTGQARLRLRLTMTVTYSPAASHNYPAEPYATNPSDCATEGKNIFLCPNPTCMVIREDPLPIDSNTHSWYAWKNNGNGTHTRTCKNNAAHTESGTCSGGSEATRPSVGGFRPRWISLSPCWDRNSGSFRAICVP